MRKKVFVGGTIVLDRGQCPLCPNDVSGLLIQVPGGTALDVRALNIFGWITGCWGETPVPLRDTPGEGDIVILGISGRPHLGKDPAFDNGEAIVIRCGTANGKVIVVYSDMGLESAPDEQNLSPMSMQMERYQFPAINADEAGDHTATLIRLLGEPGFVDPNPVEVLHPGDCPVGA